MTTYATDVYTGTGSQVNFRVTFEYIQRNHVKVFRVENSDGSETELSRVDTNPVSDEYEWMSDVLIQVGTAPTTAQKLRVERDTPIGMQLVQWKDGSYIIADDLNTSEEQSLYLDQEMADRLTNIENLAFKYFGFIDVTADKAPANPTNGTFYVNTGVGTVRNTWIGIVGDVCVGAEQVVYNSVTAQWEILQTPSSQVGVNAIAGAGPITVDGTTPSVPIVGILSATTSAKGALSAADKTKLNSINAGAGVDIQSNPPSNPEEGQVWWDKNDGRPYIWYEDADSQQWVDFVPNKRETRVSVKDFGAAGDGITDDTAAINAAISAANAINASVYFPYGTYFKQGSGGGKSIMCPAGTKLFANGDATIKSEGYPNFTLNDGCEVKGITFDSTGDGVLIGLEIKGNDITVKDCVFLDGNQVIYLYTADRLLVDGCRFVDTGYQVLQKSGFTSHDGRVINCSAINCRADFVELNSTGSNPSRNWLISGNLVRNAFRPDDPDHPTVQTEVRFFGSTATDGVIITNNIVETIAGDSAIHCEGRTKNLTVSNNIFIDCHSTYGKIVFFPGNVDVDSFHFSGNIIRYTDAFTAWAGEGDTLVQANNGGNARIFITNNTFTNESLVTTLKVAGIGSTEDVVITGNRVRGFDIAFASSFGASGATPRNRRTIFFRNNVLESCNVGCQINEPSANRHYRWLIDDNVFDDVTDVYISGNNSMPESLTGNSCRGATSIDEAKIIGKYNVSPNVNNNWVDTDSTTTRKIAQIYTDAGVAKTLFSPPTGFGCYDLHVKTTTSSTGSLSGNNASAKVVRLERNSNIDTNLTEISASSSGTNAGFTLALDGTDVVFSAPAVRTVQVKLLNTPFPYSTPVDITST